MPTLPPTQANRPGISACMTKRALEEQWGHLVSARFEELDRDIKKTATVDGVENEVLLSELGWDLSKKKFEDLVKGKHDFLCATCEQTMQETSPLTWWLALRCNWKINRCCLIGK